MQGERQLQRRITIDAPREEVWAVLADARLLPRWVPAVDEVLDCAADGEAVGASRTCAVQLAGRSGRMVERCVEFEPMRRLAYLVEEESFGMTRSFAHYGFVIGLEAEAEATGVTVDTHYTPRTPIAAIVNVVLMRRRFRGVVDELLAGLRTLVEARSRVARSDEPASRDVRITRRPASSPGGRRTPHGPLDSRGRPLLH